MKNITVIKFDEIKELDTPEMVQKFLTCRIEDEDREKFFDFCSNYPECRDHIR